MRWISNSPWCVRAWRGELDLPVTFFLIGLVGMAAVVSLNVAASLAETAQDGDWLQWIQRRVGSLSPLVDQAEWKPAPAQCVG